MVLWSKKLGLVDSEGQILRGHFGKLAIANPRLAPYGLAAQETLENLKLWNDVQNRLVMGESISQTMQFADSGNADLAFIALSQTIKDGKTIVGSLWRVPPHLYHPIRQDAVRLAKPQNQVAATAFLNYLKEEKAIAVIRAYGYDLP
ncbi:molybdate transport system substrate-binding protein [Gammaproteobacteria bacterium]